jgi:autotransporter-associated beta strand protein
MLRKPSGTGTTTTRVCAFAGFDTIIQFAFGRSVLQNLPAFPDRKRRSQSQRISEAKIKIARGPNFREGPINLLKARMSISTMHSRIALEARPSQPLVFLLRVFILTVLASVCCRAPAATRTWDGGGTNAYWTNRFNWQADVAPVAGDDLVFPSGAVRLVNTNTFPAGTLFGEILFSGDGYRPFGNQLAVTNHLTARNAASTTNSIFLNVLLNAAVTIDVTNANAVFIVSSNLNLNGHLLTVQGAGQVELRGVVSGSAGIVKNGSGTLRLAGTGANTFSGAVTINGGTLLVGHASALGATTAGTILNGNATLRLEPDVRVGTESLSLNTTGGSSTPAAAVHADGGSNRWAGPIIFSTNAVIEVSLAQVLNLAGAISGSGDFVKTGTNTLIFSGGAGTANTYTGRTVILDGTLLLAKTIFNSSIRGPLIIGDAQGPGKDVVRLQGGPQIDATSAVTIVTNGVLDLNGQNDDIGSLTGFAGAAVTLGSGVLTVGLDNTSTDYAGSISGTGGLTKAGAGTLTLSANSSYVGPTIVNNGTLLILGTSSSSQHTVNAAGTLGGRGIIGPVSIAGGTLAPGTSVGRLTSSNTTFNSASDFEVELNGVLAGISYDQLKVQGSVTLGNSTLRLLLGFAPSEGDQFVIIDNDGADAVNGTFAGLSNGSILTTSNLSFRVNYNGGSGNDVILTLTNTALRANSVAVLDPNGTLSRDDCVMLAVTLTNISSQAVTGIIAVLSPETDGVSVVQAESAYPNIPSGGRAANLAAFQVMTATNLSCTTNVQLKLTVFTSNKGVFSIPLTLSPSCTNGSGPCELCTPRRITGAITINDAKQRGRLTRVFPPSVCESNKPCPAIFNEPESRRFDAYTFANGSSQACVTVTLSSGCPLTSAAYLGQHNPTNICENYLGDLAQSISGNASASYSFSVPANAIFVVVVNEVFADTFCDYDLDVTGGGCSPHLFISRLDATRVLLNWPGTASGYHLESATNLPAIGKPAWTAVTNRPAFFDDRVYVTNAISGSTRFFQLRQP